VDKLKPIFAIAARLPSALALAALLALLAPGCVNGAAGSERVEATPKPAATPRPTPTPKPEPVSIYLPYSYAELEGLRCDQAVFLLRSAGFREVDARRNGCCDRWKLAF
jgi:hypothetical protein